MLFLRVVRISISDLICDNFVGASEADLPKWRNLVSFLFVLDEGT